MTAATFWLLTLVVTMADGSNVITNKTYGDEATCRAAGQMSTAIYSATIPAGFTCTQITADSAR